MVLSPIERHGINGFSNGLGCRHYASTAVDGSPVALATFNDRDHDPHYTDFQTSSFAMLFILSYRQPVCLRLLCYSSPSAQTRPHTGLKRNGVAFPFRCYFTARLAVQVPTLRTVQQFDNNGFVWIIIAFSFGENSNLGRRRFFLRWFAETNIHCWFTMMTGSTHCQHQITSAMHVCHVVIHLYRRCCLLSGDR